MSANFQYSRILLKRSSQTGATPTINTGSTDFTDGTWIDTDIMDGELFLNTADDLLWVRTSNGILPISLSGGTTTVTGSQNVGTGAGVFKELNAGTLKFYSFSAGTNVTITTGATEITINATGGGGSGETNTMSSVGSGNSIFKQKTGVNFEIRSLSAGTNVTITTGDTITINASSSGGSGETNTASSVGVGNSIFKQKSGVDLEFRSLSAGTNITITTGDTITINSTGGGGAGSAVINGLNTYTGGSFSLTSVNISAATLSSLSVSGNTTLGSSSASSIVILNSGSSISDSVDYSSNRIVAGVSNSAIGAGSGNTINSNLRNVFVSGFNLTATNSDHSYFSNIVVTGTSQGNVYATNLYSGSTNLATIINNASSSITAGNYLGKSGSTTLSLTGVPVTLAFAISDETTQITSGTTAKLTIYAPKNMTLTSVKASLTQSGSTSSQFDINVNGSSILSTKLTIDANEFKSVDASVQPVISSASISEDAKITVDIDAAGTGAAGAKIYLLGYTII